ETTAYFSSKLGKVDKLRSRGDRDEIHVWIKNKWLAAGFKEGKDVLSYFDYSCNIDGKKSLEYGCMKDAYKGIRMRGSRLEVHGILDVPDIDKLVNLSG